MESPVKVTTDSQLLEKLSVAETHNASRITRRQSSSLKDIILGESCLLESARRGQGSTAYIFFDSIDEIRAIFSENQPKTNDEKEKRF